MNVFLWILGGAALIALSARWNWWRPWRNGVTILMYHKIGVPPAGSKLGKLWVSPAMFRRQMNYLKLNGYTPILFRDIYAAWDGKASLPSRAVLITFDDGYRNNHAEAFPILKELGFPATLFTVVNTVGGDNRWHDPASETRIDMVSWDELRELDRAGWEIGSHTMDHPRLPRLTPDERRAQMEDSRRILGEKLGRAPDTFAYPYGAGEDDPAIREQAAKAGYRISVGVHAGKWTVDEFRRSPHNLPRVFVRGGETMLDFHLQMTRGQSRL